MHTLTLAQTLAGLRRKKFSAAEVTKAYLDRIEKTEKLIDAYLTVTKDLALERAKKADKAKDFSNPLAGIPMNLKDVFCTAGIKTTASSKILKDFVPPYNAHVVDRLFAAGAILLGKTNCDEFAHGSSCENSAFKPTKNPWNIQFVPGGSSGGSAASVSADQCVFSMGTDTGGSIRQPASLCSVVGLKVTYGRVPRHGVMAYASSFDTIGHFAKTVEDAAIILNVTAGISEKDPTTTATPVPDYTKSLKTDLKGVKVGVPKEFFGEGVDEATTSAINEAVKVLKKLGAEVCDVSLSLTKYAIPTYYLLAKSEASTNLARYDGIRFGHLTEHAKDLEEIYMKSRAEGFGDEVKRAIMIGTYALSAGYFDAFYLKAAKVRALMKKEYEDAFKKVDVLITPTSPFPAFKIGEKADDPLAMYMADILTTPINLAGVCAMSVPAGFSPNNLPIGMQIIAGQYKEENLFHVGHAYEQATEWHKMKPTSD
jgi:aspartyl-tRNA(Asn)/glutamyl-tRNA(Gln) amidotransferase subunit A